MKKMNPKKAQEIIDRMKKVDGDFRKEYSLIDDEVLSAREYVKKLQGGTGSLTILTRQLRKVQTMLGVFSGHLSDTGRLGPYRNHREKLLIIPKISIDRRTLAW